MSLLDHASWRRASRITRASSVPCDGPLAQLTVDALYEHGSQPPTRRGVVVALVCSACEDPQHHADHRGRGADVRVHGEIVRHPVGELAQIWLGWSDAGVWVGAHTVTGFASLLLMLIHLWKNRSRIRRLARP